MGSTSFRVHSELRETRRWLASILLLALAGGAALTAAQAARRTDTAYARALADGHASDAVVNADTFSYSPTKTHELRLRGMKLLDRVDRSPLVVAHGRFGGSNVFRFVHGHLDQRLNTGSAFGLVAYDTAIGRSVATLRIESGRMARPDRAHEVTINTRTAQFTGWRVGTRVTDLREYDMKDLDPETGAPSASKGTALALRVVGIVELPEELLLAKSDREPRVFLTPAYARRFPEGIFYLNEWVRLQRGAADLPALRRTVTAIQRTAPEIAMPVAPTDDGLVKVNQANDPLVNGLWILAALAALVGILLAAQSLGRSFSARANDHAQLRAMGTTRSQRFLGELTTLVIVAIAAAILAAIVGYVFSPLTPVGGARNAEPHPGFSLDLALTAIAVAAIFVGTTLAAIPAVLGVATARGLPGSTTRGTAARRSRIADLAASSGLGAPAVVGTRLALQPGRGANATPVRSVLASLTLVVAAVTATFAFGANLARWTTTPRLYGWNWDAAAGSNFGGIPPEFEGALARFPNVTATGGLTIGHLTVAGHAIPAIGVGSVRGTVAPALDSGRVPRTSREIVFGAKTMRSLHTHIGAVVDGTVDHKRVKLTVVGRTTFPAFGDERFGGTGLGNGALGTTNLFRLHDPSTPGGHFNYLLLRFAPGTATKSEQRLRAYLAPRGCSDASCVITDARPAEIDGYRSAHGLPLAIGIVLVLLLVATLTHVLSTTMRRRAGDLSTLRAIGSTPRNLIATMRWQALVLTGSAILIGVPCGLIASRFAWIAFSSQLGIAPGTVTPVVVPAVAAIGLLALAWLLATVAGLRVPNIARRHRFTV